MTFIHQPKLVQDQDDLFHLFQVEEFEVCWDLPKTAAEEFPCLLFCSGIWGSGWHLPRLLPPAQQPQACFVHPCWWHRPGQPQDVRLHKSNSNYNYVWTLFKCRSCCGMKIYLIDFQRPVWVHPWVRPKHMTKLQLYLINSVAKPFMKYVALEQLQVGGPAGLLTSSFMPSALTGRVTQAHPIS